MTKVHDRAYAFESRVAKKFGASRTGFDISTSYVLSKSDADVDHARLAIECKRLKDTPSYFTSQWNSDRQIFIWQIPLSNTRLMMMHSNRFFEIKSDQHHLLAEYCKALKQNLSPRRKNKVNALTKFNGWWVRFYDNHWPAWILQGYRQAYWYSQRGRKRRIPVYCRDHVYKSDRAGNGFFIIADVEHWDTVVNQRPRIDSASAFGARSVRKSKNASTVSFT